MSLYLLTPLIPLSHAPELPSSSSHTSPSPDPHLPNRYILENPDPDIIPKLYMNLGRCGVHAISRIYTREYPIFSCLVSFTLQHDVSLYADISRVISSTASMMATTSTTNTTASILATIAPHEVPNIHSRSMMEFLSEFFPSIQFTATQRIRQELHFGACDITFLLQGERKMEGYTEQIRECIVTNASRLREINEKVLEEERDRMQKAIETRIKAAEGDKDSSTNDRGKTASVNPFLTLPNAINENLTFDEQRNLIEDVWGNTEYCVTIQTGLTREVPQYLENLQVKPYYWYPVHPMRIPDPPSNMEVNCERFQTALRNITGPYLVAGPVHVKRMRESLHPFSMDPIPHVVGGSFVGGYRCILRMPQNCVWVPQGVNLRDFVVTSATFINKKHAEHHAFYLLSQYFLASYLYLGYSFRTKGKRYAPQFEQSREGSYQSSKPSFGSSRFRIGSTEAGGNVDRASNVSAPLERDGSHNDRRGTSQWRDFSSRRDDRAESRGSEYRDDRNGRGRNDQYDSPPSIQPRDARSVSSSRGRDDHRHRESPPPSRFQHEDSSRGTQSNSHRDNSNYQSHRDDRSAYKPDQRREEDNGRITSRMPSPSLSSRSESTEKSHQRSRSPAQQPCGFRRLRSESVQPREVLPKRNGSRDRSSYRADYRDSARDERGAERRNEAQSSEQQAPAQKFVSSSRFSMPQSRDERRSSFQDSRDSRKGASPPSRHLSSGSNRYSDYGHTRDDRHTNNTQFDRSSNGRNNTGYSSRREQVWGDEKRNPPQDRNTQPRRINDRSYNSSRDNGSASNTTSMRFGSSRFSMPKSATSSSTASPSSHRPLSPATPSSENMFRLPRNSIPPPAHDIVRVKRERSETPLSESERKRQRIGEGSNPSRTNYRPVPTPTGAELASASTNGISRAIIIPKQPPRATNDAMGTTSDDIIVHESTGASFQRTDLTNFHERRLSMQRRNPEANRDDFAEQQEEVNASHGSNNRWRSQINWQENPRVLRVQGVDPSASVEDVKKVFGYFGMMPSSSIHMIQRPRGFHNRNDSVTVNISFDSVAHRRDAEKYCLNYQPNGWRVVARGHAWVPPAPIARNHPEDLKDDSASLKDEQNAVNDAAKATNASNGGSASETETPHEPSEALNLFF